MNIDELVGLIDNGRIQSDSSNYQLVDNGSNNSKRSPGCRTSNGRPNNRPKRTIKQSKLEFKYINLEKLIPGATLRQFADWKADIANLFATNPSKFRTNFIKFIAT